MTDHNGTFIAPTGLGYDAPHLIRLPDGTEQYRQAVRAIAKPASCPACGSTDDIHPQLHEKLLEMRDAPIGLTPRILEVEVSRWRCSACGARNIDSPLPIRENQQRYTVGFRLEVAKALRILSPSDVSRLFRVSKQVIQETIETWQPAIDRAWAETPVPAILAIDHVHIKREVITTVVDWQTGRVDSLLSGVDGVRDRAFLERPAREDVAIVIADYCDTIAGLTKEVFPKAVLVIDPPHAIRAFRARGLKWLRYKEIAQRVSAATGRANNNALKQSLETAFASAKPTDALNESAKEVRLVIRQIDEVEEVYQAYHGFRRLYRACRTPDEAYQYLVEWRAGLSDAARKVFRGQLANLSEREADVLAFFRFPQSVDERRAGGADETLPRSLTTCSTESANNQVKKAYQRAHGCGLEALRRTVYWKPEVYGWVIDAFDVPRI